MAKGPYIFLDPLPLAVCSLFEFLRTYLPFHFVYKFRPGMKPEPGNKFFQSLPPTLRADQRFGTFPDFLEHIEDMRTFCTFILV
jgi:hypothetical protein